VQNVFLTNHDLGPSAIAVAMFLSSLFTRPPGFTIVCLRLAPTSPLLHSACPRRNNT